MSKEQISLKAIDDLIKHLDNEGDLESSKFLMAVRSHYGDDKELHTKQSIPTENILKSIVGDNRVPDSYFVSLKSLVNATLTNLFNKKLTPYHLNIDHRNNFSLSQSIVAPKHPGARTPLGQSERTGFKTSELMFNLPREIHEQFKVHLKNIKDQEEELSLKLEEIFEAENGLIKEKNSTAHEISKVQKDTLNKIEKLRNTFALNNSAFKDEISQLKNVIASTQNEYSKFLNQNKFDTDSLLKMRQNYENSVRGNSNQFELLFNKLTTLYSTASANEEDFIKRKTIQDEQSKTKELRLEKISESQIRQQKELNTQARQLTIAKRNYKAQLDIEFKQKIDELNSTNFSLEEERAKVESELNDIQDKKYAEELIIQKKKELLYSDEKEKLQAIRIRETEVLDKLNDTLTINSSLEELLRETNGFLSGIRKIYEEKVNEQKSDYKSFKLRIQELENESLRFCQMLRSNEKRNMETSIKLQKSLEKQLKEQLVFVKNLEKNQKEKIHEYHDYIKGNQKSTRASQQEEKSQRDLMLKNLINYEKRLFEIGEAFEGLSESFQKDTGRQKITILPEEPNSSIEFTTDIVRLEWKNAIKQRIEKSNVQPGSTIGISRNNFIEKWGEWVSIPSGSFQMRNKNVRKSTALISATIKQPINIKKYPVTNIEFFQFVNETDYITDAEKGVTAIVYRPGVMSAINSPDNLSNENHPWPSFSPNDQAYWLCPKGRDEPIYEKQFHPVTQVTWNDARAYCQWKSEVTGSIIRLPTEIEWEFAFRNLGNLGPGQFPWQSNEIPNYCNTEEAQRFDTTSVDEFPYHDLTAGVQDMLGNVQEWVMDGINLKSESNKRIACGGSFVNTLKELNHCQKSLFQSQYCSNYIGFRVAWESD
jgi:formylglycine-generating enzyme required for sulfatase activity